MSIKFNILHSFVVLGECLHFGEAAEQLNISQSALTKQIRRLEEDLGAPLFFRNRQGTRLTRFGQFFLDQVRPLLLEAGSVIERGRRAAKGELGRLVIGFSFSTVDLIARVIRQFRRGHDEVDIELRDLSSADQMDGLMSGAIQLGFVRLPVPNGLSSMKIVADGLALVLPTVLAERIPEFDVEAIRDLPFVSLQRERAPGLYDHIRRFCAARSFEPRVIQQANESLTVLSLVSAGVGVSLMHRSALRSEVDGLVIRPVDDPKAAWDVGLAWRQDLADPLVHAFIDQVAETIALPEGA